MRPWYSRLSLRIKISSIALSITTLSLTIVAVAGILQIRAQIALEEHRSAESVALGFARAAELAMTVGDTQELSRLAASFTHDQNVLFIAAYDASNKPLASAARDKTLWANYQSGTLDTAQCMVAQRSVEASALTDEFSTESNSDLPPANPVTHAGKKVGHVVVGLSTVSALDAQRHQNRLTAAVTGIAAVTGASILFLTLGQWMRRLTRLAEVSWAISGGNFSGTINDKHDDEIGRLARSFDDMRAALRRRDQELRQFTDTLQEQVKDRTKDLQKALTVAEDANRAKSLFLANMSHELRTPLNGVIGMVDLLLAAQPNAQQRRYCDIAKSSARSLVELINDILDFSKIEAGKLELDITDFDLHESVESVTQILAERAQQKGVELLCRVDPALPRIVGGDPVRLRQIILNLVSNAVKFTEKGAVLIDARLENQTEQYIQIRVSVKDSGIGIPKDRLDRLFKSFSQVDASTTRKYGGTGLGLAISQRITEMMNGQIGVTSEEGKGSTFWFTARLDRRSQATALRRETSADPRGLRVLAVDDNQTNREILQSQLSSWSLRADIAIDADEAIGMLNAAHDSGDPYRFAILDMHMPKTDGMQLASTIKNDPRTRDVILISLSSISDHIKKEQMNDRGFAACLTKPVLPSQLYDTIVTSLAANESDHVVVAAASTTGDRLDGVRVLLAEDNEVNRLVATELLQLIGCECEVAVNGQEAVNAALSGTFDVILMDCQMPILDGFEATRKIRELESLAGGNQHRKIIALTANAIKGDRELCLAAGMDEYLTKPIEPRELLRTIRLMLSTDRAAQVNAAMPKTTASEIKGTAPIIANAKMGTVPLLVTQETGSVPISDIPISDGQQMGTVPILAAKVSLEQRRAIVLAEEGQPMCVEIQSPPVDLVSLQRRCVNNRKLAAKALRMFDGGIDKDMAALTQGVIDGNAKAVAAAAHKIKGAASNISAEFVRKTAAELEKLGRDDAMDQAQNALDALAQQIASFRGYLETAMKELVVPEPTPNSKLK